MIPECIGPRSGRIISVKRKRSDLTLDVKNALGRLQETIDRLNSSYTDLPSNVKTLIDLIQTQTAMIEALATCQHNKPTKHQSLTKHVRRDTIFQNQTHSVRHGHQTKTNDDHAKEYSLSPQTPRTQTPQSKSPIRCLLRTKRQSARTSKTSSRTSNSHWDEPTPPPPPPKDEKYTFPSQRSSTTTTSPKVHHTIHPPSTPQTQYPSPFSTALFYESLAHRLTATLMSTSKSAPLPLGPLDNGTITLHSTDYLQHQPHIPSPLPSSQSNTNPHSPNTLLVYSQSATWTTDFPGIPAPRRGEVAMELVVHPDCLLIVKPFAVPRYAGCQWRVLEALGDHALPTAVQVMFLGRGLLRLRVRCSELMGGRGKVGGDGDGDRWVEFVGVWRPNGLVELGG